MKVRCEYCQNMVEASETVCPSCGARLPGEPVAQGGPVAAQQKGAAVVVAVAVVVLLFLFVLAGIFSNTLKPDRGISASSAAGNSAARALSALKNDPKDAEAYKTIVGYYLEKGKVAESLDYARQLLENCPSDENGQWCVDFYQEYHRPELAARCAIMSDIYTGTGNLIKQVKDYTVADLLAGSPLRQAMELTFSRQASAITLNDLQRITYMSIDGNFVYCGFGTDVDPATLDQLIIDNANWNTDIGMVYFQGLKRFLCTGYTPSNLLLPGLEELSIPRGAPEYEDLTSFAGLKNLKTLTVGGPTFQSLNGIRELRTLESLGIVDSPLADLSLLPDCKGIKALSLKKNERMASVASLARMSQLERLTVSGEQIAELSPIKSLTGLTALSVTETSIRNADFLKDLPNLRELEFAKNEGVSQLPDMASAGKLEKLILDSDDLLTAEAVAKMVNVREMKVRVSKQLSFFDPMQRLEKLTIYSYRSSLSVAPLANHKELRVLNFSSGDDFYDAYTTSLANISALRSLPLEELYLKNKGFYEPIDAIFEISTLRTLDLRGASSEGTDYSKLANLKNLRLLLLDEYRAMLDIPPGQYEQFWSYEAGPSSIYAPYLAQLTGLEALSATGCGLEDIEFVRDMPKLNFLDIADNAVSDISPLKGLAKLQYVKLTGNPIIDYGAVEGRDNLIVIR